MEQTNCVKKHRGGKHFDLEERIRIESLDGNLHHTSSEVKDLGYSSNAFLL
ncbi:MAG: hypothetical protein R6V06_07860 [Kiritimatiellia bacterium]